MKYAPARDPARPMTMASTRSGTGACSESSPRAARNPAGIMTISLGKGMNELSIAMKAKMSAKPQTGASAAIASRWEASESSMA